MGTKTSITRTTELRFGEPSNSIKFVVSESGAQTTMKIEAHKSGYSDPRETTPSVPSADLSVQITDEDAIELATLLKQLGFEPRDEK